MRPGELFPARRHSYRLDPIPPEVIGYLHTRFSCYNGFPEGGALLLLPLEPCPPSANPLLHEKLNLSRQVEKMFTKPERLCKHFLAFTNSCLGVQINDLVRVGSSGTVAKRPSEAKPALARVLGLWWLSHQLGGTALRHMCPPLPSVIFMKCS